jgi:hypothetical protein
MEMTGQLHASVTLPLGKGTSFLIRQEAVWATKSMSEWFGEQINLLILPGIEPRFLDRPFRSLFVIPTELFCSSHAVSLYFWFTELSLFGRKFSYSLSYSPATKGTLSLFLLVHFWEKEEKRIISCVCYGARNLFAASLCMAGRV